MTTVTLTDHHKGREFVIELCGPQDGTYYVGSSGDLKTAGMDTQLGAVRAIKHLIERETKTF